MRCGGEMMAPEGPGPPHGAPAARPRRGCCGAGAEPCGSVTGASEVDHF